jgi:ankyrin repeat protein
VKDSQQNNALHIAAYNGNYIAIKSLIEKGFKHFKSKNKDNLTPLQVAAIGNYIKAQNTLISYGASVEQLKSLEFYGNHNMEAGDSIDGIFGSPPLFVHRTKFNSSVMAHIDIENEVKDGVISAEISGGWRYQAEHEIDIDFCDIDKRDSLTAEQFYEEYFRLRKPVVIKSKDIYVFFSINTFFRRNKMERL